MPRHGSRIRVLSFAFSGWRPWLGLMAILLLIGGGFAMLRAAAPSLRWHLDRGSDRLRIWLTPAQSLLAGYVMGRTTFTAFDETEPATRAMTLVLKPGEVFSAQVAVRGPDPSTCHIVTMAPVPPALISEDETSLALILRASEPLTSVRGAPSGSWQKAQPRTVTLKRGAEPADYRLLVTGPGGGRSVWRVKVPALPEAPLIWFGAKMGGQVYLTIDDGWFPSASVLALMQRDHIPVTAFLIAKAAVEHPDYWRAFAAAGGEIEDHTVNHPNLTLLTLTEAEAQWQGPVSDYPAWFGVPAPTLGRPPYGAVSPGVRAAAWAAGLRYVVMWSAEWVPGQGVKTWNGGPIQAGEIILLHWVPGVGKELSQLLKTLAQEGLHPAPLNAGDI